MTTPRLLLRTATFADGSTGDVRIVDGLITELGPNLAPLDDRTSDRTGDQGETVVDLDGRLLLPALTEPHSHLDKAFLADVISNPTGDLMGAIEAMLAHRHLITLEHTIERAERAARLMLSNGVTAIRTHADTTLENGRENGLQSVHALIEVRERLRGLVDIQVCALSGWPSIGVAGAEQRALLRDAVSAGVDLIGGCPHLEPDAAAANEGFLSIAADAGLPIDLHTDETLDPAVLSLEDLARRVISSGFPYAVTASHCVSLGVQTERRQREVAELVATAGISVVALPHTNLFLQGRQRQSTMPRALTALRALSAAGVNVAAGADNMQDPFNPVGRGDPLETAALMIVAGHLLPDEAFETVSRRSRTVLRLASNELAVGGVADLVAIRAPSIRAAIAMGPGSRVVVKSGRIVAGDPTWR